MTTPFDLSQFTQPGISRSAKGQITQNNFIKGSHRAFEIRNQELETKAKFEKKRMDVLEIVNKPRETKKQRKENREANANDGSGSDDGEAVLEDKEQEKGVKKSLEAIQKLREKEQAVTEKRERAKREQEMQFLSISADEVNEELGLTGGFGSKSFMQSQSMRQASQSPVAQQDEPANTNIVAASKDGTQTNTQNNSVLSVGRDGSKLTGKELEGKSGSRLAKQLPPPAVPKKATRDQEIAALRSSMALQQEQANKLLAENKQKMAERMGQIVEVCRYDAFETVKTDGGEEVEQTISKVDFTKFRREFVSLNMNEGIKVNIKEARIKKETAKIEKELEFHQGKMRKKPVKQQKVGGLTAEELHERVQKEKHEQHAARRRHLQRAFAGIDRSQRRDADVLFKTVTRDQAQKHWERSPQGTEVGRYDPIRQDLQRQPCFVRIQDDKAEKEENKKYKAPTAQYAQAARCQEFVPNVQHDEVPQVHCEKLGDRLKKFKDMIAASSKRSLAKHGRQSSTGNIKGDAAAAEEDSAGIDALAAFAGSSIVSSDEVGVLNDEEERMMNKNKQRKGSISNRHSPKKATNLQRTILHDASSVDRLSRNLVVGKQGGAKVRLGMDKSMDSTLSPAMTKSPRQKRVMQEAVASSIKLKQIYDQKDLLEKSYGEPVLAMSPINHVNSQYASLLSHSIDTGMWRSLRDAKPKNSQLDLDAEEPEETQEPAPTSTKRRSPKKVKGRIPCLLENLHRPVAHVSMAGINSSDQYTIDFVANESGRGVKQVYQGLQAAFGSRVPGTQSHLPEIDFERQTSRKHEFLRPDDDARSERFNLINQFPTISTKANCRSPKGVPNMSKGALRVSKFDEAAKPKFNCHHYIHDPNFACIRDRTGATLVPFDASGSFTKSVSIPTSTRNRLGKTSAAATLALPDSQANSSAYLKYHERFQSRFHDKLKSELQKQQQQQNFDLPASSQQQAESSGVLSPLRHSLYRTTTTNEVENPGEYFKPKLRLNKPGQGQKGAVGHYFILND